MEIVQKTIGEVMNQDPIQLPYGFEHEGRLHNTAELGEMTGEVDEAVADPKVKNNVGKIITEALTILVKKLGTIKPKKEQIRAMASADRDFLLLINYIKSVATDEFIHWSEQCRSQVCQKSFDLSLDYTKIPVYYLQEGSPRFINTELPGGVRKGDQVYKKLKLSMPTGEAQETLGAMAGQNLGEALTKLYALVTEDIEGLDAYSFNTFREMLKKDRSHIQKTIAEIKLGADMTTEAECPYCGTKHRTAVPVSTLLGE